jgi:NitT/TauT family transport system substrate-binding protein
MDPRIKSLKDLKPGDKIATPAPDAINSLVLRAALERQGLPANYLDVGMVAMAHPLAEQALLNRQVVAHIATPPFAQDEVRKGGRVIMHTADAFPGGFSSTVVVASTTFAREQKPVLDAFFKEYADAVKTIQSRPDEAAKTYVDATGGKGDLAEITSLFRQLSASIFSIAPHGVMDTARFMAKHGLIKNVPASFAEISLGYVDREAT